MEVEEELEDDKRLVYWKIKEGVIGRAYVITD